MKRYQAFIICGSPAQYAHRIESNNKRQLEKTAREIAKGNRPADGTAKYDIVDNKELYKLLDNHPYEEAQQYATIVKKRIEKDGTTTNLL